MCNRRIIWIWIFILVLLTACTAPAADNGQIAGLQTTAPSVSQVSDTDELVYTAVYGSAPDWLYASTSAAAGNGRFWQTASRYEAGKTSIFIASFAAEGGYFERHPYELPENHVVNAIAPIPGEPDALWFIESVWQSTEVGMGDYTSHTLVRCDADGNPVVEVDITRLDISSRTLSLSAAICDAAGNVYLYLDERLYIYDKTGAFLFDIATEQCLNTPDLARVSDGRVAILTTSAAGSTLKVVDITTRTDLFIQKLDCTHLADGDVFHDLYVFEKELYGLDITTGTLTRVLRFADIDVNSFNLIRIVPCGTSDTGAPMFGCYEASGSRPSPILLKQVTAGAKKAVLTLAVTVMDQRLQEQIILFNRKNTEYRIDYTEYAASDDPSGLSGLSMALTAGEVPDLLDLSGTPSERYIEKGLLRDLTSYMETDKKVTRDNIHPTVLRLIDDEGAIYGLSPTFAINATAALRTTVGEVKAWDFEAVNRILDAHPDVTQPIARMTREYGWQWYLGAVIERCVDRNAGICDFESDAFLDYLDFCARFPATNIYDDIDSEDLLAEGKALLMYRPYLTPRSYLPLRERFGEDLLMPGVPGTGNLVELGHRVAMTTACAHPDAAWAFIRQYTSCVKGSQAGFDLPVLMDEYEAYMTEIKRYNDEYADDNSGVYRYTDADYAAWETLVDGVTDEASTDTALYTIVFEEIGVYLGGGRSAAETARVINSRVGIALAEQR